MNQESTWRISPSGNTASDRADTTEERGQDLDIPSLGEATKEVVIQEIETYVNRRQNNFA